MATLETFKEDMELVNTFSGSFIDSVKGTRQKVNNLLGDFNKALEEERQNKLVLQSIENTISESELHKIFRELTESKTMLIQNNTQSIQNIAKTIKDKNNQIQEIQQSILDIDQLLSKFKIVQ